MIQNIHTPRGSVCPGDSIPDEPPGHTDTWVYKKSKHEFCVLASKHVKIGPH